MDVVVNAPDTDTQCIVLLEAQARGVPILTSDVPLAHEFCGGLRTWDQLPCTPGLGCADRGPCRILCLAACRRASVRSEVRKFVQRHREAEVVRRLCRLYEDAVAAYRSHGTTPQRHWDSQLAGWVYRTLTDGPVPVIQRVRTP